MMNNLSTYIIEKLKINKESSINNGEHDFKMGDYLVRLCCIYPNNAIPYIQYEFIFFSKIKDGKLFFAKSKKAAKDSSYYVAWEDNIHINDKGYYEVNFKGASFEGDVIYMSEKEGKLFITDTKEEDREKVKDEVCKRFDSKDKDKILKHNFKYKQPLIM